jgi:hypothetical protein
MEQRTNRRQVLRAASKIVAGTGLGVALHALGELRTPRQASAEHCFWVKGSGPFCSSGQLKEQWCFRCCAGTQCWTEWCENRVVGTC